MTSPPRNLLTEWAALLLKSVADAGVRDVVISPGSRSTPFVVAAFREPRLRCRTILDERAAAFFALGQARVTETPTLLVCTSGTAGAHYLPAIIEASAAFIPLLVLTADRPLELAGCAAPQTIDQIKLFGDHVRHFCDLGMPDPSELALRALRRTAFQAVSMTTAPTPGAVHLNARARKPLEPAFSIADDDVAASELTQRAHVVGARSMALTVAQPTTTVAALRPIARACRAHARGIIVCGPAPLAQVADREAIRALSRASGFPIAPEATSQLRFTGRRPHDDGVVTLDTIEPLFKSSERFRERHGDFDVAIQIGRPPTSSAWGPILARTPTRIVVARHGWNDPDSAASHLVFGDVGEIAKTLVLCLEEHHQDGSVRTSREWIQGLIEANAAARRAVVAEETNGGEMTEGRIARCVVESAPRGSRLMLGNSLAVRLVDTFATSDANDLGVLSQRGASGIDGNVAGAAGSAVASDQATTLLLGDLTLLHDLTSLAVAAKAEVPLVIVVVQNYGGRIFEQLPIASAPGIEAEILDATMVPHALEFAPAAAMFGVRYAKVEGIEPLRRELAMAYARTGCTLLEVVVPPHGAALEQRRLLASLSL